MLQVREEQGRRVRPAFVHTGKLPGCNEYINACRANVHVGNKMKRDAQMEVYADILNAGVGRYGNPIKLRMVWHEPKSGNGHRRDFDNIVFAKKFILDAMQDAHVIANDDLKHIVSITDEVIPEERPPHGVEVYIEEVERGW